MKYLDFYHKYMDILLKMSLDNKSEVPVFALSVYQGEIISIKKNMKEEKNDPTSHAEIEVIRETAQKLGRWRLNDITLYVTLEPCPMCAAAIIQSRIKKVVFGCYDQLYGAFGSKIDMRTVLCSNIEVVGGIRELECSDILKNFFLEKRNEL